MCQSREPGVGVGVGESQGPSCAPWGGVSHSGCELVPQRSQCLGPSGASTHLDLLGPTGSSVCGAPGRGQMGWEAWEQPCWVSVWQPRVMEYV